jgi:hypothetical protein
MLRLIYFTLVLVLTIAICMPAYAEVDASVQAALTAARDLSDGQMQDTLDALTALSQTTAVQSLNWSTMQPLLATLQNGTDSAEVWYALPNGMYYTASGGLMGCTLSTQGYFAKVLAGDPVAGVVVPGPQPGSQAVVVAVPILDAEDNPNGLLQMSHYVDWIKTWLGSHIACPAGMQIQVLDADGMKLFTIGGACEGLEEDAALKVTSALTGWTFIPLVSQE